MTSEAAWGFLGSLADTPLVELFQRIAREEKSGDLRVTLARASRTIYFDRDFVVFASSNLIDDRLGESMTGVVVHERRWRSVVIEQQMSLGFWDLGDDSRQEFERRFSRASGRTIRSEGASPRSRTETAALLPFDDRDGNAVADPGEIHFERRLFVNLPATRENDEESRKVTG